MFNIYVSSTKKEAAQMSVFPGLSLGEVRGFLLDLFARDLKKKSYTHISDTLSRQIEKPLNKTEDTSRSIETIEDILYEKMNAQQIVTTIWKFSDKTIIVIKSG